MCTYIYTGAHGLADKHVETHNFQACGNPDGVLGTFVDYSLNQGDKEQFKAKRKADNLICKKYCYIWPHQVRHLHL